MSKLAVLIKSRKPISLACQWTPTVGIPEPEFRQLIDEANAALAQTQKCPAVGRYLPLAVIPFVGIGVVFYRVIKQAKFQQEVLPALLAEQCSRMNATHGDYAVFHVDTEWVRNGRHNSQPMYSIIVTPRSVEDDKYIRWLQKIAEGAQISAKWWSNCKTKQDPEIALSCQPTQRKQKLPEAWQTIHKGQKL